MKIGSYNKNKTALTPHSLRKHGQMQGATKQSAKSKSTYLRSVTDKQSDTTIAFLTKNRKGE